MSEDLLEKIQTEIWERRQYLAPLVREHEVLTRLLAALDELEAESP